MRRRRPGRRKKKDLIERLEANLTAAIAAQAASAPSTPALSASWRPLERSTVGAERRGGGDDVEDAEEAVVVARGAATDHFGSGGDEGFSDEDGPRWPDENEEAAVLAERAAPTTIREQIDHAEAERQAEEADSVRDLPELDALVARLPAAVRDGLEELFRAKYTKVRRLPKRVFSRPPEAG